MPFRLQLSAPASTVEIDGGNGALPVSLEGLSGTLETDPANPVVMLTVKWREAPETGELRFAKLILEPAGKETITHVFDAAGDIDDIVELPSLKK